VTHALARPPLPPADICERALDSRDPRFDGLFFVGITSTGVYCRPTCPARVCYTDRRRFFDSAASAEQAGFRPCLRCRPELAPGRAPMDAVPRLARVAADRIGAGALNGHGVGQLASELGVSERHLRRALEREIGVSPLELAQTHRLLLAKRLLTDTSLSVTRIAFTSGFQSLRRFNSVFRERYRLCPSALRRGQPARSGHPAPAAALNDLIPLTLAYRPPLNWNTLLESLGQDALPGVEWVEGGRYARTVRLNGEIGAIFAGDAAVRAHVIVHVSVSLLPVLMPLLARLRQLFDLDAEPTVVDTHLEQGGLGSLVRERPGIRIPGALDGFEVAFRALLRDSANSEAIAAELARGAVSALGEPIAIGIPQLTRLAPSAARVAEAGPARLVDLGVPRAHAAAITAVARAVVDGSLRLAPGESVTAARRALGQIEGVSGRLATALVLRAMHWPDAFPASDRALQRAAGASGSGALLARSEAWRPWRAYAALHLWLHDGARVGLPPIRSRVSPDVAWRPVPSKASTRPWMGTTWSHGASRRTAS
jgi:AraC family transcriptional regulator of adaptative response / DNA-3-methyladenine glycosylase II